MLKNYFGSIVIAFSTLLFASVSHAAAVRYTFEGDITVRSINTSYLDPLAFTVIIDANTDNIRSDIFQGLGNGTTYTVAGSDVIFTIDGLGTVSLGGSLVFSTPLDSVVGFAWTESINAVPGFEMLSGAYSLLDLDSTVVQDDLVQKRPSDLDQSFIRFPADWVFITGYENTTFSVTTVPLPTAVWLFGSGILGLTGVARRKRA